MNKNKIITIIVALIMILGITITLTQGFNVEMNTREHNQIIISLGKDYKIEEIKEITKEVFEKEECKVKKVDIYDQDFSIETRQITDEQKNAIVTKINEKYQTELKAEDIDIKLIPRIRLKDYITPHILELVWSTLAVTLYIIIRYRKLGVLKVLIQTILEIIITLALVFSIIAISRIQIGSNIVTILLISYALAILGLTTMFENRLQKLKEEEESKNKKTKNA